MPEDAMLSEREELILKAVVQCYISTAEPVGSRVIVKRFGLDMSPATVRNVMADLEEAGYLQQLHTSSGRVPTDRGYRYFVNYLMHVQELTLVERARIEREFSERLNNAEEVLRQTSHLLALITHQTGIVQAPDESQAHVRHIEVMPVTPTRAAVLIADSMGRIHTVMTALDDQFPIEDLPKLAHFMNDHLRGQAIDQLTGKVHGLMRTLTDDQRRLAEQVLYVLNLAPGHRPGQLYLEGASQLFEQPEFRDIERAREVFGLLDERDRLMALLRARVAESPGSGPAVVIGLESQEPGLKDISVVASPYHVGNQAVGVVGVLGPRRMQYPRLAGIVDYTAGILSKFLTKLAG